MQIAPSAMVRTSQPESRTTGNVWVPTRRTAVPSANPSIVSSVIG